MKEIVYKKILVTHDGSKLAAIALPHALSLALKLHASLVLLRVIESVSQEISSIAPGVTPPVRIIGETAVEVVEKDRKTAQEQLERVEHELEEFGVREIQTRVEEGSPGELIVSVAKEEYIDLIIMATHGASGLKRTFLGSVADYVIRHARCPVLVVRAK